MLSMLMFTFKLPNCPLFPHPPVNHSALLHSKKRRPVALLCVLFTFGSFQAAGLRGQDAGNSSGASASGLEAPPQSLGAPGAQAAPVDASLQVAPPSVTLPTPELPKPPALPEPSPEAQPQATPQQVAAPEFNPPSAESLGLPSAQPAGNPQFAPASVGMPVMTLDESLPDGETPGPGPLGGLFDWAKKLLFQVALRGGYDSNVNSAKTNAIGSVFGNVNGGINYRFGTPRLNFNSDLTGGLTWYPNNKMGSSQNQIQGTIGLGLAVEYRYSPRMVLTFNTSTSYQQQPNVSLIGSGNNQNGSYIYSANSLAAAYQWSELFTTVTRFGFIFNYYLQGSQNTQQGFSQPTFTQSFRWLVKPTTTAVVDYNTDLYGYANPGQSSWGQSLAGGFDHTFNPRWFWNLRAGAEFRTYQNSIKDGTYIGPYFDNNFNWQFGQSSQIAWLIHLGTQPSGQQDVSYATSLRSGLNYIQGLTPKLKMNAGFFYLLCNYQDAPLGANGAPINYYQTNLQGNVDLTYNLNRIIQLALGYQYLSSISPAVPNQEYNRGISYLQVKAAF